ncbi:MAG: branched-chain amino acid ABC transporter permease [Limnochordales bacterium]|nr:branched-chain amino acid ABC transporter permease [Limnochordales bacterium]
MFAQQLINGLVTGSTYALIALGYTMVYGVLQLINFAHGEIYMVGAFAGLLLVTVAQLPFPVALLLAMGITALLGVTIEFLAYRPLRRSSRLSVLISAIGMSIFVQNVALWIWGPSTRSFRPPFPVTPLSLGGLRTNTLELLTLALALLMMVGLHLLVTRTKLGKAMRAVAQDRETAALMGINVNRTIAFTFAIGSSLAAAAGVMVGMLFNAVVPNMGVMPGLKGFVAAVLGGIGHIPGAMLGGLLLGMAEVLGVALLSSQWRDAVAFAILIVVLLYRPSGLLGRRTQEKV